MKTKSIYELVGITKKELEGLIPILHPNAQSFIEKRFTKKYFRRENIKWNANDNNYFFGIIRRLKKLSKRKDNNQGFKTRKSILERIGCTKEELTNLLPRLETDVKEFLLTHFNNDFTFKSNYDNWSNEDKNYLNYYITNHIKYILKAQDNRLMPLTKRFNNTKEELDEIILLLSEKSQRLIKLYYDEDYYLKLDIKKSDEDRKYLSNFTFLRIKEIISKKGIPKYFVYRNLLEYYGLTKYQMTKIVSSLKPKMQKFINKYYDENYELYKNIELTTEERYYIHRYLGYHGYHIQSIAEEYGYNLLNQEYNETLKIEMFENIKSDIENPVGPKIYYNKELDNLKIQNDFEIRQSEKIKRIEMMREFYKNYQDQLISEKNRRISLKRTK